MVSITRFNSGRAIDPIELDLSDIAEFLRGGDGVVPHAQELFDFPEFEDSVLRCWGCGNSVDADCCTSQEIEYGGFPLLVPICSVCSPLPDPFGPDGGAA